MTPQEARAAIVGAPQTPGVYVWRDSKKYALYVGKASRLKSRLSSYAKTTDPRIALMVSTATRVEWFQTQTESEALIEEARLIKALHPRHNVVMRDDKQHFMVALTEGDFGQLIITHQHSSTRIKKPIRTLIGPFTDGPALKSTMSALRRMFPTCTCKQTHHVRCLNAHIGKCPGYCCLKALSTNAQRREYKERIRIITDLLQGKRSVLIRRVESSMKAQANRGNLQEALRLKRLADSIRRVFANAHTNRHASKEGTEELQLTALASLLQIPAPQRIEAYDVANISGVHAVGAMVVFTRGVKTPAQYRTFTIRHTEGGDVGMMKEMIARRLAHTEWPMPDLILVDGGQAQLHIASMCVQEAGLAIPVIGVVKNERHRPVRLETPREGHLLSSMPTPAARLIARIDEEAHRFSISKYRARHRASIGKRRTTVLR